MCRASFVITWTGVFSIKHFTYLYKKVLNLECQNKCFLDMVQKLMGDMMYFIVCFVPIFDALWVEIKRCIALYFIAFSLATDNN